MHSNLTDEERLLLARMVTAGKWDSLIYDLSIMCPAFIIVGFGIHFNSSAAIITGMVVYAVFALRTSIHQAKSFTTMKSLAEKLRQSNNNPQPPVDAAAGAGQ